MLNWMQAGAVGAPSHAHVQTPLGHLVQHGQLLGESDGVVVGEDAGALRNSEIIRYGGEMGADLHGARGRNVVARVPKVVLPNPTRR